MREARQWIGLVSTVLIAAAAHAADEPIGGQVAVVKPAKLAKLVAKNPAGFTLPVAGASDDPTLHGAQIRFFDTAGGAGSVTFSLDQSGWSALGSPPGAAGYKYTGKKALPPDGTCTTVIIKPTVIKAVCKGVAVTLTPPFSGDAGIILGLPSATASGVTRYCAEFGGTLKKNANTIFKHTNADPPSSCAINIAYHTCPLGAASQMKFYITAIPGGLAFPATGAIEIGSDPGGTDTDCRLQSLSPVLIPSIGMLCFSPITGCPIGTRYCGPGGPGSGPALGVDVSSDATIGSCTSNTACQSACATACAPGTIANGNCTGFCTGSSPADLACTSDAACLPSNGSCQGPEPVGGSANICQCSCTNTAAHGASDPGDGQCYMGLTGALEAAAPCDGTDVLIQFGSGCLPVSNQRVTAHMIDANFAPGAMLPVAPNTNDQSGTSLACSTFDTGALAGLVGVGGGNFFGSALGDVSIALKAVCQ